MTTKIINHKKIEMENGKIPCKCGCGSTKNLQRHHWNYEKPLLVNTLCKDCHDIQHVKNFQQSKYARMEIAQ
jgi:hypothetical protein